VGHGSANRILLCVALGTDLAGYRRRFVQGHTNLTVLRWDIDDGPEGARLQLSNDRAHLRGAHEAPWA
jgi:broad specificity phosphatase PhoE